MALNIEEVRGVVGVVARAVAKAKFTSMNSVLLEASPPDTLLLTADNLETRITGSCGGRVTRGGKALLPERFVDIVAALPGDEVAIVEREKHVTVEGCGANFVLYGMDVEDYPEFTVGRRADAEFSLSGLATVMAKVGFASSRDNGLGYRAGVLVTARDGRLKCTATDNYRLAEYGAAHDGEFQFLLPRKALEQLARVFGDTAVGCRLAGAALEVSDGRYRVCCRLLTDNVPDFSNAWPGEPKLWAEVEVDALRRAFSRSAILADAKHKLSALSVSGDDLVVRARSEIGNVEERVALENVVGSLEGSNWNIDFLLEGVRAAGADKLSLHLNGVFGPCVMGYGTDAETWRYLVLPVRLQANQ